MMAYQALLKYDLVSFSVISNSTRGFRVAIINDRWIVGVEDPLDGLGEKEKEICSQIAEMGFPISRLAAAAR